MSHDSDHDLLDEIKNERNSQNTKASLISLFEGDKSAVFTPSTATSFISAIIGIIIVGTLWWSSVNSRLEQLSNTQQEMLTFYENIKTDVDVSNRSVYEDIRKLEKTLRDLEVTYNTEKKITDSELQQKLLNITVQLNDLSGDLNDLYNKRNDNELYKRDIKYSIEKLRDRIERLEKKYGIE